MSDEIKAKIVIEADTSGAEEAAAALEKLQGMAGDGSIGDALAQQFKAGEEGAKNLTEALGDSGEALKANEEAFNANEEAAGSATQAIEEQTQVVGDLQSAHEDLQPAIEDTNKNLTSMQEMLAKSTPAFSQAAENMSAFQDALVNPEPFNMVQQYLSDTGQSWGDFIDAVGPDNANQLVNAQNNLNGISNGFVEANKSADTFTGAFTSTQAAMDEFTQADPWANFNVGAQGASKAVGQVDTAINQLGGIGSSQYGPLTFADTLSATWKTSASDAALAAEQMGGVEGSLGKVFSGALGDVGEAFMGISNLVMPLMAFQMVGTMVAQVGQAIYDAASIAEGPAAHSMGTFTGSVDALTQSAAQVGETFSESFGRQLMPTLDAMNDQINKSGGAGGLGSFLGGATDLLANLGLIVGGVTAGPFGGSMVLSGAEGLANQFENWLGIPESFQGPGPQAQAKLNYQQQFANLPQTVQQQGYQGQLQADTYIQEASDPSYLAGQQHAYYAQQYLQQQQIAYDVAHPYSAHQALMDYRYQQDTQAEEQAYKDYEANPPTYAGDFSSEIASGNWGGVWNTLMQAAGFAPPSGPTGNAGMMGTAESIFGGGATGPASGPMTSIAQQMGLPTFASMGNNIGSFLGGAFSNIEHFFGIGGGGSAGIQGPISAAGFAGPTNLSGFQMPHIDMGAIASNVAGQFSGIQLPHLDLGNIGSTIASNFSGISLPHLDLGNIGSSLAGAFGGIQLPHLDLGNIGSSLAGAFSGIQLPHLDLGNIGSTLAGAFSGITMPHIPDLGGMINGALGGMFSGITLPSIPDLGGMINGALGGMFSGITLPSIPDLGGMINGALGGMFSGITIPSIPDIGGVINGALGGMFGGIQMPNIPDVGGMINGALGGMFNAIHMPQIPPIGSMINSALSGMFSGIMIPGFASGVEGFGGGLAVVGENGPELVSLPGGSSVYPMSSTGGGLSPVSLGGGGSSGAQTANISIYLGTQLLTQIMGMSLASDVNISTGNRAF